MTKKKKFNSDYNQAWSKLTKKQILSNEHVEQDLPRSKIYIIYIIQEQD